MTRFETPVVLLVKKHEVNALAARHLCMRDACQNQNTAAQLSFLLHENCCQEPGFRIVEVTVDVLQTTVEKFREKMEGVTVKVDTCSLHIAVQQVLLPIPNVS